MEFYQTATSLTVTVPVPDLRIPFDVSCTASEPPGVDLRSAWKRDAGDRACRGAKPVPRDSNVGRTAAEGEW